MLFRTYFFHDRFYGWGITTIKRKYGDIRINEAEKTIGDTFCYRSKLGEDLALESLRNYLNYRKPDIGKLIEFARQSQTKTVMTPYLRALVEYSGDFPAVMAKIRLFLDPVVSGTWENKTPDSKEYAWLPNFGKNRAGLETCSPYYSLLFQKAITSQLFSTIR